MKIAVVGTGYVGLVVGACLAETGNDVTCVDKDAAKVRMLRRAKVPIYEPGLSDLVRKNAAEGRLTFTAQLNRAVKGAQIVFIAVGTPQGEDGSADLQHVMAVAREIGRAMDGYQVIVNIALHDDPRYSLPDEAGSVKALGLEYIHIPVIFDAPTAQDLERFFDVMDRVSGRKVWVHCAANKRVSTFLGLYWHLCKGQPREQAFALMRSVWEPNEVWSAFVTQRIGG